MSRPKELFVVSAFAEQFAAREDVLISEMLKRYGPTKLITIRDISSPDQIQDDAGYIFRCIYEHDLGHFDVVKMKPVFAAMEERRVPYIQQWNGKGDQTGKGYLVNLYAEGHQVVPSFRDIEAAIRFNARNYLVKPLFGGTGHGIATVSRLELRESSPALVANAIIQPELKVQFETSLVYVDNAFQFAVKTRDSRWDLVVYKPDPREFKLAETFIGWNPIKGVQRIDFLWADDEPLLLELEDATAFLSLFDSDNTPRASFVEALYRSIMTCNYDH